jgi:hypothetical protein
MATDNNEEKTQERKSPRDIEKAAAEYAASKINPDTYWALYMSFKANNENTDAWNRETFLEFLKDNVSTINVIPDNTRIYQKHKYCCKKFETLLEQGKIKRFNEDDFPLPPTSRGITEEVFIGLAANLYG